MLRRKLTSAIFVTLCGLSVATALLPLAAVLYFVVSQGISSINLAFFTQMPKPVGVQQPLLVHRSRPADLIADGSGLHLRDFAVRGLAPPGLGGGPCPGVDGVGLRAAGADDDRAARADAARPLSHFTPI